MKEKEKFSKDVSHTHNERPFPMPVVVLAKIVVVFKKEMVACCLRISLSSFILKYGEQYEQRVGL